MGDPFSLAVAAAALVLAAVHAYWVSRRDVELRIAVDVTKRLLDKGDLSRAIKLSRAGDETLFFQALRPSLLRAAELRSEAPGPSTGSYREAFVPARRDEAAITSELAALFERGMIAPALDLKRRRTIGLIASWAAVAVVWRVIGSKGPLLAAPPIVASLAFALAVWSLVRSWRVPLRSREALDRLLPSLARVVVSALPPDNPPRTSAREEPPPPPPKPTPVTSWPEEHGIFYAFEDDEAIQLYERLAALVKKELRGRGLRVADLSRVSEPRENRPPRLVAALGERASIAGLIEVMERERAEGRSFPDALCMSEPQPSDVDRAASFRARRAYFDVRAAIATGEYEILRVEEPLG